LILKNIILYFLQKPTAYLQVQLRSKRLSGYMFKVSDGQTKELPFFHGKDEMIVSPGTDAFYPALRTENLRALNPNGYM
jgi:hypothetical protein